MINPSRYVVKSTLHQGTKSQLHQRKGFYLRPYTQYEDILCTNTSIRVDDTGPFFHPTPSPVDPYSNGDLSYLHTWDYDTALSGQSPPRRDLIHFFLGYFTTARDITDGGFDNHPVAPLISQIYNLSWPSLPSSAGTTPQLGGKSNQAAWWCWVNSYEPNPDTGANQYIWQTCTQKCRYRYTIDSWGFQAIGDLWANSSDDGGTTWRHGWVSPNTTDQWALFQNGRITLENIHLLSTRTNIAPMTWINVDPPYTAAAYPDTYRNGFLGRYVFSVDFETTTQFTARTGLAISP